MPPCTVLSHDFENGDENKLSQCPVLECRWYKLVFSIRLFLRNLEMVYLLPIRAATNDYLFNCSF